ncbi:hypothetical protein BDA96_03G274100 [Sorghum bicolor]|uniref:Uncharacterized protein n=2 Tax=Sorghum bicolor TaxID=4558 RepID=A0A921UP12_SORBI|nr:hypothetical protein BDA96_03G274100 [Sorghum bicolor]OQU87318.1 hypothetical protein SORBI_3003G253650 [Sorghum bicolor]
MRPAILARHSRPDGQGDGEIDRARPSGLAARASRHHQNPDQKKYKPGGHGVVSSPRVAGAVGRRTGQAHGSRVPLPHEQGRRRRARARGVVVNFAPADDRPVVPGRLRACDGLSVWLQSADDDGPESKAQRARAGHPASHPYAIHIHPLRLLPFVTSGWSFRWFPSLSLGLGLV